ncbi:hypothetical protein A2U01_0048728, partial [Trifolium medium]|nr:hypothetical protein [Trifolium medium]
SGKKVNCAVEEIGSGSLQKSSESSNRNLQRHKESVALFDAATEKIETDNRDVSVKINQVVVVDSLPSPESTVLQAKTLPGSKPPDVEVAKDSVELDHHPHRMPRPPSKPPDVGRAAVILLRRAPLPPEPPDACPRAMALLPSPQPPEPPDTGSRGASLPQSPAASFLPGGNQF